VKSLDEPLIESTYGKLI